MPDSLPVVPPDADLAQVVYDGEVVDGTAAAGTPGPVAARSPDPLTQASLNGDASHD